MIDGVSSSGDSPVEVVERVELLDTKFTVGRFKGASWMTVVSSTKPEHVEFRETLLEIPDGPRVDKLPLYQQSFRDWMLQQQRQRKGSQMHDLHVEKSLCECDKHNLRMHKVQ